MIDFLLGVPGKLKTIADYLTTNLASARCTKLDQLDAAVSSRAPSSTAVSAANYTSTRAGYLDLLNAGGIPGTVKSIQTGYFRLTGGFSDGSGEDTKYKDITISAMSNISKCVATVQTMGSPVLSPRLTSTTNLRLSNDAAISSAPSLRWTVVEYY